MNSNVLLVRELLSEPGHLVRESLKRRWDTSVDDRE